MPFYFRKSVSAGPFRFNFSSGGVGVSVGVKGLRIGAGPRGHYIAAGRNGFYYRASLSPAGSKTGSKGSREGTFTPSPQRFPPQEAVQMVEVESSDVLSLREEKFADLLDEINSKQAQWRLEFALPCLLGLLALVAASASRETGLFLGLAALLSWPVGKWGDTYRRRTVLFYDLEGPLQAAFERVTVEFDRLLDCAGKWHIEAGGAVRDLTTWKRNAGASHIIRRSDTELGFSLPKVIASNISPPFAKVGKQTVYFFPDVLFIVDGRRVGAVGYDELVLRRQESAFIEEGAVPSDARIIRHTWKHPNKNGGPDRRFASNRQIPVCLYEALHLSSRSGLNELLEFSQVAVSERFIEAVQDVHRASFISSPPPLERD